MKIVFHRQIARDQHYKCICCGAGCRSFVIPIRPAERRAIADLADWRQELGLDSFWISHRAVGSDHYGLAKRPDNSCVFLDENNLCIIHKRFGLEAKPLACQLYPFVLTPMGDEIRIGLRFDCTAVQLDEPGDLKQYRKELEGLAKKLLPENYAVAKLPRILPRQTGTLQYLDAINNVLLDIVSGDGPMVQRLGTLDVFLKQMPQVRWDRLGIDDLPDFLTMIKTGAIAEAQRPMMPTNEHIGKPRKLLGQFMFLLCQPNNIVRELNSSFGQRFKHRLGQNRDMRRLGLTSGPLPKIHDDWPDCDISEIEDFDSRWSPAVEQVVERFLICRFAGFNYCGTNFYNYSIWEGATSMLLAVITAGFLMRVSAIKNSHGSIDLADAYYALKTIDGNLGYSPALGMGPARLRLTYLSRHIPAFIKEYCD